MESDIAGECEGFYPYMGYCIKVGDNGDNIKYSSVPC